MSKLLEACTRLNQSEDIREIITLLYDGEDTCVQDSNGRTPFMIFMSKICKIYDDTRWQI